MVKFLFPSLIGALVGGGTVAAFLTLSAPSGPTTSRSDVEQSLARVAADVRSIEQRVGALESRPVVDAAARGAVARVSVGEPDAAKPEPPPASRAQDPGTDVLATELAALVAGGFGSEATGKFLALVRTKHEQEAAIAAIKDLVEKNPGEARAHYLLAKAYEERLMVE